MLQALVVIVIVARWSELSDRRRSRRHVSHQDVRLRGGFEC